MVLELDLLCDICHEFSDGFRCVDSKQLPKQNPLISVLKKFQKSFKICPKKVQKNPKKIHQRYNNDPKKVLKGPKIGQRKVQKNPIRSKNAPKMSETVSKNGQKMGTINKFHRKNLKQTHV